MTLLIIVMELHTGLLDTKINMVYRGDDDLDYWVQVAPGYTVSLQVRIRANCTEAEMRGDCTDYTMLLSIEIRERKTVQRLRGEETALSATQCTNGLHHS